MPPQSFNTRAIALPRSQNRFGERALIVSPFSDKVPCLMNMTVQGPPLQTAYVLLTTKADWMPVVAYSMSAAADLFADQHRAHLGDTGRLHFLLQIR